VESDKDEVRKRLRQKQRQKRKPRSRSGTVIKDQRPETGAKVVDDRRRLTKSLNGREDMWREECIPPGMYVYLSPFEVVSGEVVQLNLVNFNRFWLV
jgi:hypothetical protein